VQLPAPEAPVAHAVEARNAVRKRAAPQPALPPQLRRPAREHPQRVQKPPRHAHDLRRPRAAPSPRRPSAGRRLRASGRARCGTLQSETACSDASYTSACSAAPAPTTAPGTARATSRISCVRAAYCPRRPHAAAQPGPGAAIDHSAAQNGG
jgi:hypothetical protein